MKAVLLFLFIMSADMHSLLCSSTTIYLWNIPYKELSILLLKLLKCMEQSVYRLIHLGLRSVTETDNQLLICSVRFMQVELPWYVTPQ